MHTKQLSTIFMIDRFELLNQEKIMSYLLLQL